MTKAFLQFHLNLAYSSLPASARAEVIRRCYHPLLDLVEDTGIPVGIELPSWTLRQIRSLDPTWVERFRMMLESQKCELIGSGYTQLIGPLVPYELNVWNQRFGTDDYQAILGTRPRLAMVNEMAYSTGLVDVYRSAGYEGIIMDRDNVRLALGIEDQGYESVPSVALGTNGKALPVLWSDSILFQKLQRYAHGDITSGDYLDYFGKRAAVSVRPLAVYCNDAEVFDYRPGRFREESSLNSDGEWKRIKKILDKISQSDDVQWLSPTAALQESVAAVAGPAQLLSSITQPVPVKKQAKYNLSRWAVTGRNDLWINTLCHRVCCALQGSRQPEHWRSLCELWASDLRTHVTSDRWQETGEKVSQLCDALGVQADYLEREEDRDGSAEDISLSAGAQFSVGKFKLACDAEQIYVSIESPSLRLVLNLRRGLTIHSLAFKTHGFVPIIGTVPHGYFDSIEYGADYYSAGVIVELPAEHRRVTDLERVIPSVRHEAGNLLVSCVVETFKGPIAKRYLISERDESVDMNVTLRGWDRPHGIVRVGTVTLLPEAFGPSLSLECANGGNSLERFELDRECDHTRPSSSLVSSTTGLGATTGVLTIGDESTRLEIKWDPARCAAFPMMIHRDTKPRSLTRLMFSLAELDDTSRPEGGFPAFGFRLSPAPLVDD